jgi:hypothetical protein
VPFKAYKVPGAAVTVSTKGPRSSEVLFGICMVQMLGAMPRVRVIDASMPQKIVPVSVRKEQWQFGIKTP